MSAGVGLRIVTALVIVAAGMPGRSASRPAGRDRPPGAPTLLTVDDAAAPLAVEVRRSSAGS